MHRTRAYRAGELVGEDFAIDDVSDYLESDDCMIWVDFVNPTKADIDKVGDEMNLHELAIEDALEPSQRPKLDRYENFLFAVMYNVAFDQDSGTMATHEVKAFITKRAMVTIHDEGFDATQLMKTWDDNKDLSSKGVAFLVWGLLDRIVDNQYDTADALDDAIDGLEENLFDIKQQTMEIQRRSFALRKSLVTLRRVVNPMREILNTLLRRDDTKFAPDMGPYFQDVYDHVLRVIEQTDSLRDLVSTILDTNLSIQSNRMNLVMKKVTSWAAIIAVPTAITGYFGQNVPFPGFGHEGGVIFSSIAIVAVSLTLYASFKRRDWL
ncbi:MULTISPECIES: magnesium transporter CorA family protein [unclassified Frondihabitans]|jgi:magnesium transporter|uniref:magnesium transporter CorA family protein n=1 Tax=unclassified Frondihabitans TaxID=2626248 RepID=UPI0006FA726B|nr:magnesium transporter CorA family protein [Frondihabitans sp. Leaf304]KQQ27856.1 magnesium transporter [Frondihabitans sp. Leaf304]